MQRAHLVPKYGTRWALMWTHSFFKSTHARIRTRYRCQSTRSTTCTRAQKWTPGPCVHTVVTSSVTVHRFVIVAKLTFLMASDKEKWSNYVHSCISGTHGTHAVVPGGAPSLDSPSEKWNRTFAYHLKWYKFCLIGILWVFRSRYLLTISNDIKRKNGSFEKLHWTLANTFSL